MVFDHRPLGIFAGFCASGPVIQRESASRSEIVSSVILTCGIGLCVGLLVALLLYLMLSHWRAKRLASSLEPSVEGAFLRIRENTLGLRDQKLHFRSIIDYTMTQDALMRYFGIETLVMTVSGGGPGSGIVIHGVKDCLKVRDTLSENDRQRENQ